MKYIPAHPVDYLIDMSVNQISHDLVWGDPALSRHLLQDVEDGSIHIDVTIPYQLDMVAAVMFIRQALRDELDRLCSTF